MYKLLLNTDIGNGLLDNAYLLVDPKFGVIQEIKEEIETPNYTKAYSFSCYLTNTSAFSDAANFNKSNAIAFEPERAKIKAIGEALERYAAAIYRKEDFITGTWTNLSEEYSVPRLFLPDYNPLNTNNLVPFNDNLNLQWTKCNDMVRNKQTLIPASLVYLPYLKSINEYNFAQNTSTGLAFHTNLENAILNATCEIVERDAYMLHWYTNRPFKKINYKTLPKTIQNYMDLFKINMGYECELFFLDSNFGIPVIIAALISMNPVLPKFVIAASCKFEVEEAMLSALEELEQCRRYAIYHWKRTDIELTKEQVKKHEHHIIFWSDYRNYLLVRSFFEDGDNIHFEDIMPNPPASDDQKRAYLIQKIKELDYDLFIADITPIDLKTLGYSVVRAWIPQACPLTFGYSYRFTESIQLKRMHPNGLLNVNQLPHFFP